MKSEIIIEAGGLTIEDVLAVARNNYGVALNPDPGFRERIDRGARILKKKWLEEQVIYGVSTGVGESCVRAIPAELIPEFSRNLSRFHGCGLGRYFDEETTIAILTARLASLTQGFSAVRFQLLERLTDLINHRILPLIPEEGSVGASGDLTPLSYIAAALIGERQVRYRGRETPAAEAMAHAGVPLIALEPKEGLALMNGTSVMTAIACLAFNRAQYLSRLASRLTAMVSESLFGNKAHFDPRIFERKPFPGQMRVGRWIAEDLLYPSRHKREVGERIQDTYALRCAPHIIGVLEDGLEWMRRHIEIELNSVNDNPLLDPETGDPLHGGNFYGGHIAFVMDSMKNAVANIADLVDRQIALLLNENRNRGLPANLSGAPKDRIAVHHGFKAVQIGCSAWAAEALKLTMPASVFSRSTESHNQDKVSMGTISARDGVRVLELTEQVVAATMLATAQALELRMRDGSLKAEELSPGMRAFHAQIREISDFVAEDRPLEHDLRAMIEAIRAQSFSAPE